MMSFSLPWSLPIILGGITLSAIPSAAVAKKPPSPTWQAQHISDPITGAARCVVSALDYVGRTRFSRTGYLYPIVELNGAAGLLVGVSSGGRFRLPTGDILWRVDDKPFRELKAADNPPVAGGVTMSAQGASVDPATQALQEAMTTTMRMAAGMSATSTLASGVRAKEMLVELRSGRTLLFRTASAATNYGLADPGINRVGQIKDGELRPIPLDESFEPALRACSIE
ncbi:hypothetical protein [Sphingobium phenoxybenzoativorans]|uniref:hypothetical protein n=1 Tax=Sphingobium phenoxybenzoativorans TaxID=1592790 RepID=UPI000872E989|nr:hypothetical protein [Sphingobium phenoxybenzoativorans]